ncbi:MAG: peptidoglycan -binding protein [Rhodobacteraceae bacterium]|nr:peptidoglycan -binding protein [Paracoccaceae bacterium]
MALGRRGSGREAPNIWPGFVDAMTALLLVLFFVISIFMIVQFVLSDTVEKQNQELSTLSEQVAGLADALGLEQSRGRVLNSELGELNSALNDAESQKSTQAALIATLTQQRDHLQGQADQIAGRITDFEAQIAALLLQNRSLEGTLATAAAEVDAEAEAARLATARTEALRAMIADMESSQSNAAAQVSQMQAQIESATQALFLAEVAKREAQLSASGRSDEIARLQQARDAAQAELASVRGELDTATIALGDNRDVALQEAAALRAQIAALSEARRTLSEDLNSEQMARIAVLKQLADAQSALNIGTENAVQTDTERARLETLLAGNENRITAAELALAEHAAALSEAEKGQLAEAAAAEALRARMANADAELTAMTLQLEAERQRAQDTLTQLAALRAAQQELSGQDAQNLEVISSQQAALREAERLLSDEAERSLDAQRQVALLNQQTAALRQELNQLQGLIDTSAAADTEAQIRIESLGSDLNTALARAAAEARARAAAEAARADAESRENDLLAAEAVRLEAEANDLRSFRSEFFGRMREVLGGRDELQVVGDRFVFSSEVLFEPGSATLGLEGRQQLSDLAGVIRELEGEIPPEINWILQVEGHTDSTGSAASNWALSQARALSVVTYLIDAERLTPAHLSAAGFGEFQPIAAGDSPEALAANRRIELKLTER